MERFAAIDFETANGKRSSICSIGIAGKLRDIPLVAHNSPFDEGCLRAAHEAYGLAYACAHIAVTMMQEKGVERLCEL